MTRRVFAAVDIGASGGRVMAGVVENECVRLEPVHRFANGVTEIDGHLRWNLTELYQQVLAGLERIPEAESIGIDTWGVDYGLLDDDGVLLAEPIAYRDDRTAKIIDDVQALISVEDLYAITGVQFLPFNTIYQLAADDLIARAARALLLPDLLAYWLTGEQRTELTNASTTALLNAHTQQWSTTILDALDIPHDLLPMIELPGTQRGTYRGTPVITVGSHDTASAVAGVPAVSDRFAYIASGTWSLVGVVIDEPILTPSAREANFTNEIAVDGRVRFLRNVGGLWLLQECLRDWQHDNLHELLTDAAKLGSTGTRIDVDDPTFIAPGRMPERIAAAAGRTMNAPTTVRCILESLADGYARTLQRATELSGREVNVVHAVGGGSRNELLCQLTANAVGRPVLAGPVEATALGNVLVQARAVGLAPRSSLDVRRYEPR